MPHRLGAASSRIADIGGIQLHQNQWTRTEHWNESVYAQGVRTVHEYVEDYDASYVTQMSMGMTGADFDMDVFMSSFSGEHRHTEGDLNGEIVTGRRNGGTTTTLSMSMHDADFGGFAFNSQSNSWYILDPYEFHHVPGRTVNGERVSSGQDFGFYYETSGSTSSTSFSSATWPALNGASTSSMQSLRSLTVVTGTNSGQVTRDTTTSGTNTDRDGVLTISGNTTNGVAEQLDADYTLGLTDQHQPLLSMGGYQDAWQTLAGLQNVPGYTNFGTAWGNGTNAAGGTSGSSTGGSSTNYNEGWTPATNPHTGETGQYWFEYHETGTGPHDWYINWYSADPDNGGQLLWTEYGQPTTPFGGWGEGEGQAGTDTGVTPADEADDDTPPPANAEPDSPSPFAQVEEPTPAEKAATARHDLLAANKREADAFRRLKEANDNKGRGGRAAWSHGLPWWK